MTSSSRSENRPTPVGGYRNIVSTGLGRNVVRSSDQSVSAEARLSMTARLTPARAQSRCSSAGEWNRNFSVYGLKYTSERVRPYLVSTAASKESPSTLRLVIRAQPARNVQPVGRVGS